jgi:hypothetical protein
MTLNDFLTKYVFQHTDGNVPIRNFEILQLYYLATQKDLASYSKDRMRIDELLEHSKLPKLEHYIKGEKVTKYLIHDDALSDIISLIMNRVF